MAIQNTAPVEETPKQDYPGTSAHWSEVLQLANEYYNAANTLFIKAQGGPPLPYFPARFCAIHAMELYLNAFLRREGTPPDQIRKRMHNLADPDFVAKLKLGKKTAAHLTTLTEQREYLIARYAPEMVSKQSELNRLSRTLVDVMMGTGTYNKGKLADIGLVGR